MNSNTIKLNNDTIVAIATALANKAISIIRLSGEKAIDIVNDVFKGENLTKVNSHTIHYGHIYDDKGILDEVLVSVFLAPKTFTKENVVEINCHGGIYVTNKILELLLIKGARLAEPGEFTKRAFLNGRIDLTQAEAIMDVISSQTASSLRMANFGINGDTRKVIESFRNKLLQCILEIEVNIDYPEYEDEKQITDTVLLPKIDELLNDIDNVLKKAEVSQILKNGISTAIIGKPNVGKSSLLNKMIGENKAIVTDIAGTTRDLIEAELNIGGIVLKLIDTAGVRNTDNVVEKIGVEKTKEVIEKSQLIILMFDYSTELTEVDYELLEQTKDKTRIIVINKNDLNQKINLNHFDNYLLISSFNDEDVSRLEDKIKEVCGIGDIEEIDSTYIGNSRQLAKIKLAKQSLQQSKQALNDGMEIDIVNIDITAAWIALGEILGEVTSEDLINELFSRFCLGK